MEQGKRKAQKEDSELFASIALIIAGIMLLIIALCSCRTTAQTTPEYEEEKVYIHFGEDSVELVADEYDNQYLKEPINDGWIYIPYVGEVDDSSDSLQFYNVKN